MSEQFKEYSNLKQSMDQFSNDIQEALKLQREKVRYINNEFVSKVSEVQNQTKSLNEKFDATTKQMESLKKEIVEAKLSNEVSKTTYDEYQVRRKKLLQIGERLRREGQEMKEMEEKRDQILENFIERLHQQANKDNSEVKMYEELLGITIDSSTVGALSFTFTNYDEINPQAMCTMTLDVSGPSFEIIKVVPPLSSNIKQGLLETLNKENNLSLFIIRSRETLIEHSNGTI